ncbi:hypothetical protein FACS189474_3240 [Bacteroidia bacterium]|nr:hypothetical protein FACS189474_3240 [Bacteroidia bacterium]
MTEKWYFIIIIFCIKLLFTGCLKKQMEGNDDYLKIEVNIDKTRTSSIKDWFSSIELTRLETNENSLLNICNKILFHENKYYVLDKNQSIIFVYDRYGNYLLSSNNKKGNGPGEYFCIVDFDIDEQTNMIDILDVSAYKIRKYDENFNFVSELTLPAELYPITTFKILSPDLYVFYSPPLENRDEALQIYSVSKSKIQNKLCPHLFKTVQSRSQAYSFYTFNQQVFFTFPYPNNEIFRIDVEKSDNKIQKVVEYYLEKYRFDYIKSTNIQADDFIENSNQYAFLTHKYENYKYYFAFIYFKEALHIVKYDKTTKAQDIISWKFSDGGMLLPPILVDDECFYVVISQNHLNETISRELLDSKSKEILENISEDDNPVIARYYLK